MIDLKRLEEARDALANDPPMLNDVSLIAAVLPGGGIVTGLCGNPLTNLEAAIALIELALPATGQRQLTWPSSGFERCRASIQFQPGGAIVEGSAETLPLAICRAVVNALITLARC